MRAFFGNQGLKREIDKPLTNPKKDKIHTYYIMPKEAAGAPRKVNRDLFRCCTVFVLSGGKVQKENV